MDAPVTAAISYFISEIRKKISELTQNEISWIEEEFALKAQGLGVEKEIAFFEETQTNFLSRTPAFFSLKKFSEASFASVDCPRDEDKEELIALYQNGTSTKESFITERASFYYRAEVVEYLKNRQILLQSPSKNKNSVPLSGLPSTNMRWKAGPKTEAEQKFLHTSLIQEELISPIGFEDFKLHFSGMPQDVSINWLGGQYFAIYLLDKLSDFLNSNFYDKGTGKGPSSSEMVKHFKFKGKCIGSGQLNTVKGKSTPNSKPIKQKK